MAGRRPKPTRIKELAGNPGKRPLNKREPQPDQGSPTRPEWLMTEAKREWNRVTRHLEAMGLLTTADRAALANYCEWWARWVQAEKALKEHGLTFTTPNGYVQQRPEVAIAQKAAAICKSFLTEFGLTPASRSRIAVPEKKPADPFAEFLASRPVTEALAKDEVTEAGDG